LSDRARVVIVGAGQAGLAVSHELTASGVEHILLERGRLGSAWHRRWDSFCLVTPNWSVRLPGGRYDGPDPDGYMRRDEVVAFLERYARSFAAPVREGVTVRSLVRSGDGFILETSEGQVVAEVVVVATGSYQRPYRPAAAASFPAGLQTIDVAGYRRPGDLAPGGVLIVGGGQSGCQIAEELLANGREVFLSAGRVPWVPRRIGGRDIVHWHDDTGFFDEPRAVVASPEARVAGNQQVAGGGHGHDLNYRVLRRLGVTLVGHLSRASEDRVHFASDLAASVAYGDARYDDLRRRVRGHCARNGAVAPEMPDPEPFDGAAPDSLSIDALGAVIFASGFRPDYASWIHVSGAFDAMGFPLEHDGTSVAAPGLHFCGVPFMRKRKSSLLIGVGEDAVVVANAIAHRPVVV
jgi:putative flavoprotein involved in K+ transport